MQNKIFIAAIAATIAIASISSCKKDEVKDTEKQNYLEAVDHNHIHHVDDFLVDGNLVFETIVLDEGAIGSRVVIRLDFEVATDAVLLNYFGAVDFFLNVKLLPSYHMIEVLLFEVLECQPILD